MQAVDSLPSISYVQHYTEQRLPFICATKCPKRFAKRNDLRRHESVQIFSEVSSVLCVRSGSPIRQVLGAMSLPTQVSARTPAVSVEGVSHKELPLLVIL